MKEERKEASAWREKSIRSDEGMGVERKAG